MKDASTLPDWPRLMRREKAAAYLDLSMSLFDRAVSEGHLPQPTTFYASVKMWRRDDLDAWIDDRCAAQTAPSNEWPAPS